MTTVFLAVKESEREALFDKDGNLPFGHRDAGPFDLCEDKKLTKERKCMFAVEKADIVFAWCGHCVFPSHLKAALCYAYGLNKFICAARSTDCNPWDAKLFSELSSLGGVPSYLGVKQAYLIAMDDAHKHSVEKFVPIVSKFGGMCVLCGGTYSEGDSLMWCRKHGAAHRHCYEIKRNSGENGSFLFSQDLVQVLQEKLSELERQNLEYEAKCRMLKDMLKKEA